MKFVSGGYYIIDSYRRPEYMDATVVSDPILSASSCLCDFHPDAAFLTDAYKNDKRRYAKRLQLPQADYEPITTWMEGAYEKELIAYPQMFTTLASARDYGATFLKHVQEPRLIGIGLAEDLVQKFLEDEETLEKPDENRLGLEKGLLRGTEVEGEDATLLGYEVLGFESGTGSFHSYLCNGLENDFKKLFNFKPNGNGFIASLDEAMKYANYCNSEDVETEHVLWLPWAIFSFPFAQEKGWVVEKLI